MKQPFAWEQVRKMVPFGIVAAVLVYLWLGRSSSAHYTTPTEESTPVLAPSTHQASTDADPSIDLALFERAQEALRDLVQTHPAPEISRDLNRLIMERRVYLNFQGSLIERGGSIAVATYVNTPDGLLLTLAISPRLLLDPTTSRAFSQLVIYHEYIHIRQQLNRSVPPEALMGTIPSMMSDADLRIWINAEFEAYEAECQLAQRLHTIDAFELCRVYDQQGRIAMRHLMIQSLASAPTGAPVADRLARIDREL